MSKTTNCKSAKRRRSGNKNKLVASALKYRLHKSQLTETIITFLESLDSAVSLSIAILYREGEHLQIAEKDINPSHYNDPSRFRDDFTAVSFLRKGQFLKTGINLKEAAIKSFKDSELQCKVTNRRFKNLASDPNYTGQNVWLLHATTRKIAEILEPIKLSWYKELMDSGSFGPGSSYHITGSDTSAERKFFEELGTTRSLCEHFWKRRHRIYPLWFRGNDKAPIIQDASRVDTVPKNAKTDRTIAIEPGINLWFQKSLGTMIRRRLRRVGIDLNSDVKNQTASFYGSRDGYLATVDMKAASDTISKRMVEEILPPDWYRALDIVRSHSYELDAVTAPFEKFSSMGNGFTFELESLIFYCAAHASCKYVQGDTSVLSVFGDDVVIPVRAYEVFCEFVSFLGFSVNKTKSFSSESCFRESCGSYYFRGLNVKPLFLKERPVKLLDVFDLLNGIRGLASRRSYMSCDARFEACYHQLLQYVPTALRLFGSTSGGNGCIHSNFDQAVPRKLPDCLEGYSFKAFVSQPVYVCTDNPGVLTQRVYASADRMFGNKHALRRVTNLNLKRLSTPQWHNFGPWI